MFLIWFNWLFLVSKENVSAAYVIDEYVIVDKDIFWNSRAQYQQSSHCHWHRIALKRSVKPQFPLAESSTSVF